jgi:hypothetical protein
MTYVADIELSSLSSNRKRLFGMINELQTVFEVVSGARQQSKERSSMDNGVRAKPSAKVKNIFLCCYYSFLYIQFILILQQTHDLQIESNGKSTDEAYGEDDSDHGETLCGTCGGIYSADEFWIGCDICERWYHGKCVKITPAKAESIKHYKCPSCSSKRARQ